MKANILLIILFTVSLSFYSVGQNALMTPDAVKIPSKTTAEMNAISSPIDGMVVYNTSTSSLWYYNSTWSELGPNTDSQVVDQLSLVGTTLHLSLSGDGQAPKTVNLSSLSGGGGGSANYLPVRAYVSSANYGPRFNIFSTSYSASIESSEMPLPFSGTISKLSASCSRTLDSGSEVTMEVMVNGSAVLSLVIDNADGTSVVTNTGSVAITEGQKITLRSAETGGVHPGANTWCSGFITID
ncbi:hypothetical protein [Jiulongibacter sediminis]|uniref:Uncharacterized protein n=1 Tax=Jiulongibacter sediminis TaxID=1605367 RepID=A0A0P7C6P6_9BACT|nr:hypothetical protein [Jiulongibacter sediminis]KPM49086.1 hypothetical protein AFM12_00040 [Jiulongibacter sediminis]TBX26143.1 hypothetical protein TK44_00040 [Jiulongibacter sediminis]